MLKKENKTKQTTTPLGVIQEKLVVSPSFPLTVPGCGCLQMQLDAKHVLCNLQTHLIILVGVIPSQQMLLYKKFLDDSVVDGWNGPFEVFVEGFLGVRHSRGIPCCTTPVRFSLTSQHDCGRQTACMCFCSPSARVQVTLRAAR